MLDEGGLSMRHINYCLIAVFLVLLVSACQSNDAPPSTVPAAPTPETTAESTIAPTAQPITQDLSQADGFLRIAHAMPDGAQFNFTIDEILVASNMRYTTATQPTRLSAGDHNVRVLPLDSDIPLLEQTITIEADKTLILVFTGTADAPAIALYPETNQTLVPTETWVNIVHAVPRGADLEVRQNSEEITGTFAFGQSSGAIIVPSGRTTLEFLGNGQPLLSHDINLLPRFSYTLVITGRADDPASLSVIDLNSRIPGRATMRVINIAPDSGALDIYLDEQPFAQNIAYDRPSGWQEILPHRYTLSAYLAGTDHTTTQPLFQQQITPQEDQNLSLVFMGSADKLQMTIVQEDNSPIRPGQARIIFVNTLPNVPRVRVNVGGGPIPGTPDLAYGQASQPLLIIADTVNFYWNLVEGQVESGRIETAENITLDAGRSYLYLLTGAASDVPPVIFSENVGIDETLAGLAVDVTPSATPRVPTLIRFINGIEGSIGADFVIGETPAALGIAFGQASNLVSAPAGSQMITVRSPNEQAPLATVNYDFDTSKQYSVYAAGFVGFTPTLTIVEETSLRRNDANPRVRLVNLSELTENIFGLGYVPAATNALPEATPQTYTDARPSMFFDTIRMIGFTANQTASDFQDFSVGANDLIVFDPREDKIALLLPNVLLEADQLYDVVVFQSLDSMRVIGFLLMYPSS